MSDMTERDENTGATYYRVTSSAVARTVSVTDLILVDVDQTGQPVGVEVVVDPNRISSDEVQALVHAFPSLRGRLPITVPRRSRDLNQLAASIVAEVANRDDDADAIVVALESADVSIEGNRLGASAFSVRAATEVSIAN